MEIGFRPLPVCRRGSDFRRLVLCFQQHNRSRRRSSDSRRQRSEFRRAEKKKNRARSRSGRRSVGSVARSDFNRRSVPRSERNPGVRAAVVADQHGMRSEKGSSWCSEKTEQSTTPRGEAEGSRRRCRQVRCRSQIGSQIGTESRRALGVGLRSAKFSRQQDQSTSAMVTPLDGFHLLRKKKKKTDQSVGFVFLV